MTIKLLLCSCIHQSNNFQQLLPITLLLFYSWNALLGCTLIVHFCLKCLLISLTGYSNANITCWMTSGYSMGSLSAMSARPPIPAKTCNGDWMGCVSSKDSSVVVSRHSSPGVIGSSSGQLFSMSVWSTTEKGKREPAVGEFKAFFQEHHILCFCLIRPQKSNRIWKWLRLRDLGAQCNISNSMKLK